MFPLRDENPTVRAPIATMIIIGLNVFAWLLVQGFGVDPFLGESLCRFGLVPGDLLGNATPGESIRVSATRVCIFDGVANPLTLVSSMFMHGGWLHILGNMWFLWIFGDNVEDVMGPLRFTLFYLLCGLAAASTQIITDVNSIVPMVGASGAIGGVMGAYALIYPRARVHTFVFLGFYATTIAVPAVFMLGYWFILQLLGGLPALGSTGGGVAFWAHIGGFLAGLPLAIFFKRTDYLKSHLAQTPQRKSRHRWF
jgi:membrane associated rhomboid family serine protease